jgi:predicted nuclease of predicted toxin-antitoxin system
MALRRAGSITGYRVKILIDMNLSPRWARVLNEAGIEASHWSELGPANTPDPAIMVYAVSN